MDQNRLAETETDSGSPVVFLELEGRDGQKPLQVQVIVRTLAADLVTLEMSSPGLWFTEENLKGRRGRLRLVAREDQAPLELEGVVTSFTSIFKGHPKSRLGWKLAHSTPSACKVLEDLVPYSLKDMKYMWALCDEAQRDPKPGLPYKNLYLGAGGLILAGAIISRMGLSFSPALGAILMLTGSFIGIGSTLKSLRQKKGAAPCR
jgi:hypothetical protein